MQDDVHNAGVLAKRLKELGIQVREMPETNLVFASVEPVAMEAEKFIEELRKVNILAFRTDTYDVRFTVHRGVSRELVETVCDEIAQIIATHGKSVKRTDSVEEERRKAELERKLEEERRKLEQERKEREERTRQLEMRKKQLEAERLRRMREEEERERKMRDREEELKRQREEALKNYDPEKKKEEERKRREAAQAKRAAIPKIPLASPRTAPILNDTVEAFLTRIGCEEYLSAAFWESHIGIPWCRQENN